MISLIKMNIKLLFRNKGFLFFLLASAVLSTVILNLKVDTYYEEENQTHQIMELSSCTKKAVYNADTSSYIVKVYDASKSELSEAMLEKMLETGMFSICRCDVRTMTEKEVLQQAKEDAFNDRAGVLLYLKKDFDQAVLEENLSEGMQIYAVSEDERQELFETEIKQFLKQVQQIQTMAEKDSGAIVTMQKKISAKLPQKKVVNLAGKDEIALTEKQNNQKAQIGYAFAIITLGFLFCGVCVAHTVIEEQNNKVYTRVMLAKVNSFVYFLSKFAMAFFISVLQTVVLGICMFTVKNLDFGIDKWSFLFVIFLLGFIFSVLSLMLGVLLGDVMSSNYAVFAIWSISALLAGLYFPLNNTTLALKTLSYLMPQRWFMNASELLLVGDKGAYSMLLYVTVAYLVVILGVGSVGLKIKRVEA